jgi:hypothetical protein
MKIKLIDLIFTLLLALKITCIDLVLENKNDFKEHTHEPELFLPKFDYSNPEIYKGESFRKYSMFMSENSMKRGDVEPRDIFIGNDEFKNFNQETYIKKITTDMIKREVNQQEVQYDNRYTLYGFPNATIYQQYKPKLAQRDDILIRNMSELGDIINFEPKMIYIREKYIAINLDRYAYQL